MIGQKRARAFLLLIGIAAPALAGPPERGTATAARGGIRTYRAAHEREILRELADLLALPNVASDRPNIERNAAAIRTMLEKRGIRTELLRVEDAPPAVYGELLTRGAKRTVVLYAHYDGQPVNPADWSGEPWKPTLRDKPLEQGGREVPWESVQSPVPPEWRLYARSASDDKAPLVGWMAALDAMKAADVRLSINLKFFLEGEEEAGSPHLAELLEKHAGRLTSDLWLLCDGPVHPSRRMQIFFGARGITDLEITTFGPLSRVHSGHYGNWAPNPVAALVQLVATMRDEQGSVRVRGFADAVRPLTALERRAVAETPEVETVLRDQLALGRTEGAPGEKLLEAILRPALNLRGIRGGDVGDRATNSIPTEATASIDFRLVPDQTPEQVRASVEEHVRAQGYEIVREVPSKEERLRYPRIARLQWGPGYRAARTPMDLSVSRAVAAVVEEATGPPLVKLPSLGGSIPMYLFAEKLSVPVIGVPVANHDNNQHAANENLRIQNLWDAIEIYAALFSRLGQAWEVATRQP